MKNKKIYERVGKFYSNSFFAIFAYQELRKELNKIDSLRLLFSMPTFVENKKDINREFKLSGSYERGLAGDRYEMKLKKVNKLLTN